MNSKVNHTIYNQVNIDRDKLHAWYHQNHRTLPWRNTQDPYKVWISEVMLQQTTVVAVLPYYERFLKKFPTLKQLAQAKEAEVLECWSGLGYYSRARNIYKAAKALAIIDFPQTAAELIHYPGFGPYTSRAVTSFSFKERVGVLDGNVIRVLSRKYGLKIEWWKSSGRELLQNISDFFAKTEDPDISNQALMELGATICTPQKPTCLLCPWNSTCLGFKQNLLNKLPMKKPRKNKQMLLWQPELILDKGKIALTRNNYTPFLKQQMIFPGKIKTLSKKPKQYSFIHQITNYQIFVTVKKPKTSPNKLKNTAWFKIQSIQKINPSSIIKKTLQTVELV